METIEARVIQKIATPEQWRTISYTPYKGEILIVGDASGKVTNIKVGDGSNDFDGLEYMFDSIQQNVNYIPVSGYALPTPEADNGFTVLVEGDYTFGGNPAFTVTEGSFGIASWNGNSWSLEGMGELPDNAAKAKDWQTGEEYDRNTIVTHNYIQWIALEDTDEEPSEESTTWERFSPTPLKNEWDIETQMGLTGEGIGKGIVNNFQGGIDKVASAEDVKELDRRVNFLDRPDLKGQHFILDADGNVIDRLLGESHDGPRMWPEGMSVSTIDRPDLGVVIIVDKNGHLLSSENSGTAPGPGPGPSPEVVQYNIPLWNPPTQQGFNIPAAGDNTILGNYDTLISEYDALLANANINPNIPNYITKDVVGSSKVGEIPIYRYKLKPANPKVKMLLIGGTHANEKMYVYCMYEMYKAIVNDWESHPFLDFLRWNAEIDFLPSRSPYTLANDVRKRGFRVIPETPPIPVTWTRSGSTVTLTFDVEDFPSDDFLSGSNYFTAMPATALEGKTSLGVITSDDENAVPLNAYKIASVVSGNSVSIEVSGATGATQGTGSIQVWTDPNRNWQNDGSNYWEGFVGSTTIQPNDAGNVIGFFDNKGTQPLSLKENRDFLELVLAEEYDFIIDGHAPAADNDWRFDRTTGNNPDLPLVMSETGAFNGSTFNLLDRTGTDSAYTQNVLTVSYDQIFHTIEWGSGLYNADSTQVRDALRWLGIVIKDTVNNKLKS